MNINTIIDEVYEINERESIIPLSKKQICNIAKQLISYPIESEEKFRIALEYSVKVRSEIIFYTTHYLPIKYQPTYKYYSTINYSISRVLQTMGIIDTNDSSNSYYTDNNLNDLQESIKKIESDLKISLNAKKKELVYC